MVQNYQKFNSCYTFLFTRVQYLKGTVPSHQFQITLKGVTDSPVSPRSKQDTLLMSKKCSYSLFGVC